MKLLLTSGGITTERLRDELVRLLGKPIEEATALAVVTAQYGHPMCTPYSVMRFVRGGPPNLTDLPWKQVGLLDLGVLESLGRDRWEPWVREADAVLVDGGDAHFLAYWLRRSGLIDVAKERDDLVWVGLSAGSMVLTPRIGSDFTQWRASDVGLDSEPDTDAPLGLVDFSIFPHLDHPDMPENVLPVAKAWRDEIGCEAYALDDSSAIVVEPQSSVAVAGGAVASGRTSPPRVISDGTWHHLP